MTKHGKPWFVHCSVEFLEGRIQPDFTCFEWGSGGSTVWLAELAQHVTALEHDAEWHAQTIKQLSLAGVRDKADVILRALDGGYADAINQFTDNCFDLISIDGRRRGDCIRNAIAKLKPGGILVIDNSERAEYQKSINEVGIRQWERCEFYSGNSEGWTTSVYFKPKV
jgi:predicted O-methyltransferase YrrM